MFAKVISLLLYLILCTSLAFADLNSPQITNEEYSKYLEESIELKKADEELNKVYKELMSTLPDEDSKEALREEQREWLKNRSIKAFSEGPKGSQIYIDALVKYTLQRKAELENKLKDLTQNSSSTEVSTSSQTELSSKEGSSTNLTEIQNTSQMSDYSTVSNQKSSNKEDKSKIIKYTIIALLVISIISILLHLQGKLSIYKDYTDATIVLIHIFGTLSIFSICRSLDVSENISIFISLVFFFIIFFFVFRMAYITNKNFIFAIMSLLTKYTISLLYSIVIVVLIFSYFGGGKRKDESSLAYELRRNREKLETLTLISITTSIFMGIVYLTTKFKEWSPINSYFTFSFKK